MVSQDSASNESPSDEISKGALDGVPEDSSSDDNMRTLSGMRAVHTGPNHP